MPNKNYVVIIHFAEIYMRMQENDKQIFDVLIEGVLEFNNLDVYREAVTITALVKSVTTLVDDGSMEKEFVNVVENPKILGIDIHGVGTFSSTAAPNGEKDIFINNRGGMYIDNSITMWAADMYFVDGNLDGNSNFIAGMA